MEHGSTRGIRGAWVVLLVWCAVLGAGCQCTPETSEVTDWLKIERKEPFFEVVHVVELGEHTTHVSIRLGNEWHRLPGNRRGFFSAAGEGQAVLGEDRIYLKGRREQILTGRAPCMRLYGGWKEGSVACLGIRSAAPCDELTFAEFSLDGTHRSFSAGIPPAPFGCPWSRSGLMLDGLTVLGYDDQGNPLVGAQSMDSKAPDLLSVWVLHVSQGKAVAVVQTQGRDAAAEQAELLQLHGLTPPRWPGEDDAR